MSEWLENFESDLKQPTWLRELENNANAQDRARVSLEQGKKLDPDQEAKDQVNARKTGIPADVVRRNPKEAEWISNFERDLQALEKSPSLKQSVQNPDFAAQYHDKLEPLSLLDEALTALKKVPGPFSPMLFNPDTWTSDSLVGTIEQAGAGGTIGSLGVGEFLMRGPETLSKMGEVFGIDRTPSLVDAVLTTMGWWQDVRSGHPFTGPITSTMTADELADAQEYLTSNVDAFKRLTMKGRKADEAFDRAIDGDYTGLVDVVTDPEALAGFIGQAVPSILAAWASGGSMPFMMFLEAMEVSSDAADFERRTGQRIDPMLFTQAVIQSGVVGGLLEKIGFWSMFKKYSRGAGSGALSGMLGEMTTEGMQALNSNLAVYWTYDQSRSLTEGILPGMLGGGGMGAPIGAFRAVAEASKEHSDFGRDVSRAETALAFKSALDRAVERYGGVEADGRDKSMLKDHLDRELGAENSVIIPIDQASALFQTNPELIESMDEDTRESIRTSLQTGGDVEIAKSDYILYLSEHHEQLSDHLRNDIDGMSAAGAREFADGDMTSKVVRDAEKILGEMDMDRDFIESADRLRQGIEDQLVATGRHDREEANKYAQLYQAVGITIGKKTGLTPEKVFERVGLKVQSAPLVSRGIDTLNQSGLVVAGIGADGNIYTGEVGDLHFNINDRYAETIRGSMDIEAGQENFTPVFDQLGFVDPDGNFLTRQEALDWVTSRDPEFKSALADEGELDSLDYREAYFQDGPARGKGKPPGAYMFVSPNTGDDMSLREAYSEIYQRQQQLVRDFSSRVDSALGLKGSQVDAIGDWADGAENTVVDEIAGKPIYSKLRLAAALKGLFADQKAVIPFRADKNGPDVIYDFTLKLDLRSARSRLSKIGIENRTLIPLGQGSTRVVLFDPGAELIDKVSRYAEQEGIEEILFIPGQGEFLGSWETREEGRNRYREVIQARLKTLSGSQRQKLRDLADEAQAGRKYNQIPVLFNVHSRGKVSGKPAATQALHANNITAQNTALDKLARRNADPLKSESSWLKMERELLGDNVTPPAPSGLIGLSNDMNRWSAVHGRLSQEQLDAASQGFSMVDQFGKLYENGTADVHTTGKLMLWGMLSRMLSTHPHESAFIDAAVSGRLDDFVSRAVAGEWTAQDSADYSAWVGGSVIPPQGMVGPVQPSSGVIPDFAPGKQGTSNMNDFGLLFLRKMSVRHSDGRSALEHLHDMIADRSISSSQVRRNFYTLAGDVGIKNKVLSFVLLLTGRTDVVVLDRIQINSMWDAGQYGRLIYDDMAPLFEGAHGLARYEALERGLLSRLDDLYTRLGRPDDASVGRYHWESWVRDSGQVVAHPTIQSLIDHTLGKGSPFADIGAPEGRYHQYAFGSVYARRADGTPYILYSTSTGEVHEFGLEQFKQFLTEVRKPANGVVPKDFSVKSFREMGFPWYESNEVNREKLDQIIRENSQGLAQENDGAFQAARQAGATTVAGQDVTLYQSTDTASRMQRAREMGFSDETLYRGQPDIDKQTEFDPEYGSRTTSIGAAWLTDNPEIASKYVPIRSQVTGEFEPGSGVMPMLAPAKQLNLTVDGIGPEGYAELKRVYNEIGEDWGFEDFDGFADVVTGGRMWEYGDDLRFQNAVLGELTEWPAVRLQDNTFGVPNHSVVVFDDKKLRSKFAQFDPAKRNSANLLAQTKKGQPRGAITFPGGGIGEGPTYLTLLEGADLSTFLHESGHLFFEMYKLFADESPDIRADMDALIEYIGVDSLETWNQMTMEQRREGHEKIARSFEAYLFEGKSPNIRMQALFDTFRRWLMDVYKSLKNLNVNLTDEVRQVFDRMLATDDIIRETQVAAKHEALFHNSIDGDMTEEQWIEYQQLDQRRTQAAQGALARRSVADLKWLSTKIASLVGASERDIAAKRKVVKAEVTAELRADPVYSLIHFLKTGELTTSENEKVSIGQHKLDRAEFRKLHPGRDLPRGWTAADGMPADAIAEVFGFGSGAEMWDEILAAPPLKDQAESLTDQRMLAKYGDLTDPAKIRQAAEEAVHSDAHTRFLHTELNHLRKGTGRPGILHRAAKAIADRTINRSKVRNIKAWKFARAEARAAREAMRSLEKGDRESAAEHKRAQILQNHFYRSAKRAETDVAAAVKYLRGFDRPGIRKKVDQEYLDQIDAALESVGLKTISGKEVDRRKSFKKWLEDNPADPVELPENFEEMLKTHYSEMTLESILSLRDSVKNLDHIGRMKKKILIDREIRDFNRTMDQAEKTALEQNPHIYDPDDHQPKRFKKLREFQEEARASHIKIEFLAEQLDGDKANGLWWNMLFRPLADAEDAEVVMHQALSEQMLPILKRDTFKNLNKRVLINDRAGYYSRNQILSMALNQGNDGNRTALLRGLPERHEITQEVIDQVLARELTREDWRTIQDVWNLVNSYWPAIREMQERLTGVAPEKVEAAEVVTPYGTLPGGYYPLSYDRKKSKKGQKIDEKKTTQDALATNYLRPATRHGHTEARVGSDGMPVNLDITVLSNHLTEVIHDLTHREAVIAVDRVIQDKRTYNAVTRVAGVEMYGKLRPWLARVASPGVPADGWQAVLARYARRNATIVSMGLKLTTAVVQPLGWTQTVEYLGPKWAAKGMKEFFFRADKGQSSWKMVMEKSSMMRNRTRSFDRDVADSMRWLKNRFGVVSWMQRNAFAHIGFMDLTVTVPTWIGGYRKALAEGMSERDAVAMADKAVRMTQSSGGAKDLATVQSGDDLRRLLTMFYSYFNAFHNMLRRRRNIARREGWTPKATGRASMAFLYLSAIPAVMSELIVGRWPDEEDEEDVLEWAAWKIGVYPFMGIVGVRDIVGSFESGYDYSLTPAAEVAVASLNAVKSGGDIFSGEANETDAKNITMAFGYILGLPSRQLWTLYDNVDALLSGEDLALSEKLMLREVRE